MSVGEGLAGRAVGAASAIPSCPALTRITPPWSASVYRFPLDRPRRSTRNRSTLARVRGLIGWNTKLRVRRNALPLSRERHAGSTTESKSSRRLDWTRSSGLFDRMPLSKMAPWPDFDFGGSTMAWRCWSPKLRETGLRRRQVLSSQSGTDPPSAACLPASTG